MSRLHAGIALLTFASVVQGGLSVTATSPALVDVAESSPFPHHKEGKWKWVPIAGSTCMNGSETGAYIKYGKAKKKLGIYHEGGGACFNAISCAIATASPQPPAPTFTGIFNETDERNPFRDFTWIWIPYCTGDVHGGNIDNFVLGKERHFQGRRNIELLLKRATETWPELHTLLVTGESAGGFGAAIGYHFIRSHWPRQDLRALLLDDSGPVLDDGAISVCLQAKWRADWNLNGSMPADCPCVGDGGNIVSMWNYTMGKWPNDSFGMISAVADHTISEFFSFGNADCRSPLPGPYDRLQGGLRRLSENYGVSVFMIPGNVHCHTGAKDSFYNTTSNGIELHHWVHQLMKAGEDPASVLSNITTVAVTTTASDDGVTSSSFVGTEFSQ